MKKIIFVAVCIVMALSLTACGSKTIGTIKGAEYEKIVIDNVEYIRTFDSGISYSDKGKYLGNVSDGKITFKAYSVQSDSVAEYVYCMWDHEGLIYQKADFTPSIPSDGSGPFCKSIDFKVQYIRTNASSYDGDNDNLLWITSVEELNDYYEQNKDKYYLESIENPSSDQTIGFVDAVKKYDEAFFEKNDLILVVLEEPSGSNRHEVTSVDLFASLLDRIAYFIQPNIKRIIPEVGTCDMANWHIIIEIDKEYGKDSAQLKYPNIAIEKP